MSGQYKTYLSNEEFRERIRAILGLPPIEPKHALELLRFRPGDKGYNPPKRKNNTDEKE